MHTKSSRRDSSSMRKNQMAPRLAAAVAVTAGLVLLVVSQGWGASRPVVLNEIGEGERAYPSMEQDWVEDAYHQAMPFRDPGHISREEIRLEAALRHSGLVDRNKDWSFQQPLWGKYHSVMSDPTHVRTGWTGGRRIEKHSDPMQHAIEQYAYGSEGHREPEEEWAPPSEEDPIRLPDTEEGKKQDRGARNTWEYPLSEDKNYLFLTKQVSSLEGNIKDLLEQTRAESAKHQGKSIRQQLTYRVLKDELVHARLKAQLAEEAKTKEEEEEEQKIRSAKHNDDTVLQDVESELKRLRSTVHSLKSKRSEEESRRHMSAAAAQKDLSSYFTQLDAATTQKEVTRYQTKLAKLRSMVAKAEQQTQHVNQLAQKAVPQTPSARARAAHGARAAAEQSRRGGGVKQQLAAAPARRKAHVVKEVRRKDAVSSELEGAIKELGGLNNAPFLP